MIEKLYQEALARLEILTARGLNQDALAYFKEGKVPMTTDVTVMGKRISMLRPVDSKPEMKKIVDKCASVNNRVPYYCTCTESFFGTMITVFFVSKYTEEWEMDRDCLANGESCAYVYNTDEDFSDIGYVQFGIKDGCLVRIG